MARKEQVLENSRCSTPNALVAQRAALENVGQIGAWKYLAKGFRLTGCRRGALCWVRWVQRAWFK